MKRLLILGSGLMGHALVEILSSYDKVKVDAFSNDKEQLKRLNVNSICGDITNLDENFLKRYDLIIGALPSKISLAAMKKIIKAKKNMIDVSEAEAQEYLKLADEAVNAQLTIIPECGLSPGLMNFLIGYESTQFDELDNIEIKAGTLAENPFPVTWCPEDLAEEYVWPARIVRGGKIKELKPLSDKKEELLPRIGGVETFYLDGLGSLLQTIKAENMSYRGIRPLGFVAVTEQLSLEGLTKLAYESQHKLDHNTTAMFIDLYGKKEKKARSSHWQLFAESDEEFNSMQRAVASVALTFIRAYLEGKISEKGMLLMEKLGKQQPLVKKVLSSLKEQGIEIYNFKK